MKITIEAQVNAPVARVWKSYINPDDITEWNFASDDWCCPHAENDFQVNGRYCARMESKDGKYGFDFIGTYTEIVKQQKIVYILDDGREVMTTFTGDDKSTNVTTVFDAESTNSEEIQKNGWQAILDNFRKFVESKDPQE